MADIVLYKTQDQTVLEMLSQLQGSVPDAYIGDDGIIRILFEIEAGQLENAFLANQLVLQDMFVQTASLQGLIQHGVQVGLEMKGGTYASGTVTFEGDAGTYIPISTEIGYDPGGGVDLVYFTTTIDGSIPNPGIPAAPTVALSSGAGALTGTYEYRVTFLTTAGETLPSVDSSAVVAAAKNIDISNIPTGGAGTIGRRIYRDKNGAGDYRLVTEIDDNTATTYTDSVSDATVATQNTIPTTDTAHRITLSAAAEETGNDGNVLANTITELVDAPASLTGITGNGVFLGGTETEDTEVFRQRLLAYMHNPQTGSPNDLVSWAESIDGVDSATAFTNDNLGTLQNGHATVRIAGPDGIIPSSDVQDAVLAYIVAKDLANITIHIGVFTPVPLDVEVNITLDANFVIDDVSPGVVQAISDYITTLSVNETAYISGIIAVVKPLPGVIDVTVTTPTTNQDTDATEKFTPGTITVTAT